MLVLTLASLANAGNVNLINAGTWSSATTYGSGGTSSHASNVWVDLSALNVGYGKRVGIRWTDDDWATSQDAEAWYEGSLGWGWEQWGLDLAPVGTWNVNSSTTKYQDWSGDIRYTGSVTVRYAVWMSYGSTTWWDNNGGANYALTLTP